MIYTSHFWYEADVLNGSSFLPNFGASTFDQPHSIATRQEPSAQGDISELTVSLDPGMYRMSFVGIQGLASAIQTVYIDNALSATFDWYGNGTTYGAIFSAPVTVLNPQAVISREPKAGMFCRAGGISTLPVCGSIRWGCNDGADIRSLFCPFATRRR